MFKVFLTVREPREVAAVLGLHERLAAATKASGVDPAIAEGDFLGRGDEEALPLFDRLDEVRGLDQGFVGAGVEPGRAAADHLDAQSPGSEVGVVDGGDLVLPAGRPA